ncbi:MAG: P-II family nitrogen regulator [Chloroflexi bacterium]|nr:P-II family nitrogen regulator [Chloroflexota bacterium]
MNKIEAIIRPERLGDVVAALEVEGFPGLNTSNVTGRGAQRGVAHAGRAGATYVIDMLPKVKLEVVVKDDDTQKVIDVIIASARTGEVGDGKIFVTPVANAIRVRTGETGDTAL